MKKKVTKKRGRPIFVVGHVNPDTDTVCSAIAYAYFLNHCPKEARPALAAGMRAVPARAGPIGEETRFVLNHFGVPPPHLLPQAKGKNIILVDHNEMHQAVPGIQQAEIREVIDHHRIGDIETIRPVHFYCEPVGSTSTIIAKRFRAARLPLPQKIAGVLLAGLLSDTILLKSPTTTLQDKESAVLLARTAKVSLRRFGTQMLHAGTLIVQQAPMKMLRADLKCYGKLGSTSKACIGQISITDGSVILHKKERLLEEMEYLRKSRKLKYFFFMITNILSMETELLAVTEHRSLMRQVEKAFGKKFRDNAMILKDTVSRKLQVQPVVMKLL